MKSILKAALLASAAMAAIPGAAAAQAPAQGVSVVEELVVTARRREETVKDVPVAVTAVTGERLEATGAADITTLQQSTPNLTVQVARGSNSTLISFIRGVGQQDPLWGFEPGVGLYVDDVYIARPQGAVLDIFDIERMEVLRGPQGTLYGRNTIGGAIKYVTAKIDGEPEMRFKGQLGSYNQRDFIGSAKGMVSDSLGVGLTWASFDRDGYGTNLTTGAEHYNKDVAAARATVEFSPTPDLFFRLAGDIVTDRSNPRHGHREVAAFNALNQPIPGGEVLPNVYDTRAGAGDKNRVESRGVSLLGEWSASDSLTFKSISAYRAGETAGEIDFDTLPAPFLDIPARYSDHQFTQELQLLYSGDRMQAVGGLFYLNATAAGAFDTVLSQAALTIATAGHVDTESWSAFADVSFDLTEALTLSVGGRYTRDEKTGVVYRQNFTGIRSPLFGNPLATPGLVRSNFTSTDSYEKFTPRVSVSYDFGSELTGYASYSQGFKSGGFDMRADAILTPTSRDGYAPETVDSYEAGLKGYFFDRRLSLNTAVFYAQYQDQQVTLQTPVGASIASQVLNVGESHMSGAEVEGVAYLTPDLSANFALGYIKAEFDEYRALNPLTGRVEDFANSRVFQNTPEWTGAFSLTYQRDLGDKGKISFIPSASYRSSFSMFEIPSRLDQGAYWLYDASLVWTSESERYRVGLHGKNLGDEAYRIGGYNFPGGLFANSITAYYGPPQTVTLSLEAKF
ncbi:MAG: TonB-dependent receptor [Phenylobacterium sp.]|uniref:TonB-dependent receptor n=1 Tax=Phenylobacterium sp. TaxID=1871053 RepID=UPI0027346A19|nr:TonB-dependent receptor [Phenylobacterium sp.]MDP1642852.1 TonB-dependent receptor [Phenylobacterium sp.]MDP3115670.1 TonB-dependent receptor [Phenylobacterium sp.]MDP3382503.1 TonB-dependent receptor [Phenylobacterium sp.]